MVRIPPGKVQEEVDEQEDINYGTGYTEGDPDKFDSTKEMVEDVIGNEPDEDKPFSIAEAVEDDEEARLEDKPEDDEEIELESELEQIEKEEKYRKDASDE